MIVKMKKLSLIAMRSDADRLLSDLVWLSCVEVSDTDASGGDKLIQAADCTSEISEETENCSVLEKAISLISSMRKDKKKVFLRGELKRESFNDTERLKKTLSAARETCALCDESEKLKAGIALSMTQLSSLDMWSACDVPLGYGGTKSTGVIFGTVPSSCEKGALVSGAENVCGGAVEVEFAGESRTASALSLVCRRENEKALLSYLSDVGFIRSVYPSGTGTANEEIRCIKSDIAESRKRIKEIDTRLLSLASLCPDMELARDICGTRLVEKKAKEKLYMTGHTVILSGWVPEKKTEKLKKTLEKYVCFCELSDPDENDDVPVELKNNKFATPFEFVLGMYSYPAYTGYDPTFIMAVFYAIIFGMMFSDVGYGLMLVLLGTVGASLMHARGGTKKLLQIFVWCGISCMICGVLFGGYFGDLPTQIAQSLFNSHKLDDMSIICNPLTEPIVFLVISIAVGAVHLISGMIIKMCMLFKKGDAVSAVFDVGSWLVIFAGAGLYLGLKWTPGLIILGIGLAMMILMRGREAKNPIVRLFKGVAGLYDIINYASDLLSYSRIFALALAGAVIGSVVNTFTTLIDNPVITVILMIIICPLGHIFNLALSALGAFVHSCRLQYIEFFGKFYEDGGRKFEPAAPETKYTETYISD